MAFRELKSWEWLEEIEDGLDYRRRFGLEDKWGEIESIYYNTHKSMMNDGANLFLSQGDAMLSMITVPSPRVSIRALTPESVGRAPLLEQLDNTLLRDLRIQEEAETAALHAYLYGTAFLKVGYDSEWGFDPDLDLGGSLQLGLTLSQLSPQGNRRIEHDASVVPGMPWVRAVMPHDIVVPWGVKSVVNTPWIAHRVVRHIDDLHADPKYDNTGRLVPTLSMEDFVNSYRTNIRTIRTASTHKSEFVEFYEIHDRRTGRIYAVIKDYPKFIRNEPNSLQIENRLPFAQLSFTPRARAIWTTPDAFYLYHVQKELADVAIQRTKQRRISVLKFLYDSDSITEQELSKLLGPDVGAAAKVESGRDINQAIVRLENTPNLLLAQEEELLRGNAREQIGFSRNQMGEFQGGRRTATEVQTVDRSSQLRMTRRGLSMRKLYSDTLEIINNIIFDHWTLPRYVEVMGEDQASRWVELNGPQLRGRYHYDVDLVDEQELKARELEALQMYFTLSQDPSINPVALREWLTHAVNSPDFERLFHANLQPTVPGMQGSGGGGQSGVPGPGGAGGQVPVPSMQGQNGVAL
jgi:hypothetical protein